MPFDRKRLAAITMLSLYVRQFNAVPRRGALKDCTPLFGLISRCFVEVGPMSEANRTAELKSVTVVSWRRCSKKSLTRNTKQKA